MEPADYIILRFEGDYAILRRTDVESTEDFFIARAFLPEAADEGDSLHYEMFEYTLI